jgi:endonuclease III
VVQAVRVLVRGVSRGGQAAAPGGLNAYNLRMTPPSSKRNTARTRAGQINDALRPLYPEASTALIHENPLQLLIATILSAQCTDARVNLVTPALFTRYRTARDFAESSPEELQQFIKSTGFYRNKANNIRACCAAIVERFGGKVPSTLADLVSLPGVGRKTANVVLGDAFNTPGITVDTHVARLSRRLGLTRHTDPVKIEFVLMDLLPEAEWTAFSHRLILHGRAICHARNPRCDSCVLDRLCPKVGVKRPTSKPLAVRSSTPSLRTRPK